MNDIQRTHRVTRAASALQLAGAHYWTASVLPALVGTTLPLWLRPAGFAFRLTGALEFLIATVLVHAGFSFLHARFGRETAQGWTSMSLVSAALVCLVAAGLLGLHLMRFVPVFIFTAYALAVMFAGVLYVAPPARFSEHPGGEVVLSMSLGFLPVLGAYLVQTGDLTRTVYLAALPIYAAMLLWVWTRQMATRGPNTGVQADNLVEVFGRRFSGRVVVPGLSVFLCVTLLVAVLSASVMPLALVALILAVPMWKAVRASWNAYDNASAMLGAQSSAFAVHTGLCLVLIGSSVLVAAN
jgi:1,4-dihydroxy-2-naphthoate octaprenyltransferase